MLTKEEYLANGYKILGLALMSPLGKIYLDIPNFTLESATNYLFTLYTSISMILFLIGLILFLNGYDIVYKKGKK